MRREHAGVRDVIGQHLVRLDLHFSSCLVPEAEKADF
jgi:hypothetical protein